MKKILFALFIASLLAAGEAQAQTSIDVVYWSGSTKNIPEKKPGKLSLNDAGTLEFSWDKGTWKTQIAQLKTVYVSLSRPSALVEAFGLPGAAAGAAKRRKLLLSIIFADERNKNDRCVFFLYKPPTQEFLKNLETRSGRSVVYESEEARKATEEKPQQ